MIIERNGSKIELTRAELVEASEEYNWLVAKEVIEDRLVEEMGCVSEKAKGATAERYKACLDSGKDEDLAISEALAAANVSREDKKAEAVARMKMLGIYPDTIKQFENEDLVVISDYCEEEWEKDRDDLQHELRAEKWRRIGSTKSAAIEEARDD